jgi:site-specific DNA recombinase
MIYARYSTDLQNEKSVEDQVELCRALAVRLGLVVVGDHFDRAKSGASMFGRPGLMRIMQEAETGSFDVLISEAPDRISRDMADLAGIHKSLEFRGIKIECVNGGRMDTVQIGMHGVIGQMQREEGAKKTRRGLAGVVRSGRSAGGRAYGYRPVLGKPGELEVIPEEGDVIRRIFSLYAIGTAPRNIAATLNAEGVAPPRGTRWNASTINGSGKRGHGIIRNSLYSGKQTWNRVRMVKNPSTGKRLSRANPESEWQTVEVPHLRIVDQSLFERAAKRIESVGGTQAKHAPRSKRLLSGLLKCGCCNGGMSIIGSDRSGPRVQCSVFKESGACENAARYYIAKVERLVVDALRVQLDKPDLIKEYVKTYREERNRVERAARKQRGNLEREHAKAKAEIQLIVKAIGKGTISDDEATNALNPLRSELVRMEAELATAESHTNVVELHPQAVQRFKENVEDLAAILTAPDVTPDFALVGSFRSLVEAVIVQPRKAGEEYEVRIRGHLAALMGAEVSALQMVAGARLEPPTRTFRLYSKLTQHVSMT